MSYSYQLINNSVNYKLQPFCCSLCAKNCYSVPFIITGSGGINHQKQQEKLFCESCAITEATRLNTTEQKNLVRKDNNKELINKNK